MLLASQDFGDAEIHQDGLAQDGKHDVGRFDIAVNQAALVRIVNRVANPGCVSDNVI
jgi:hypothetical protein